jgi:hypothetical protein
MDREIRSNSENNWRGKNDITQGEKIDRGMAEKNAKLTTDRGYDANRLIEVGNA